ncbi:MAG TPA: SIS domain-containing protein [Trueperaceae bacterium]
MPSEPFDPRALLDDLTARYPDLTPCRADILAAFELLRASFATGGKLLVCGNGGSAADCEHIVGELMKGFTRARPVPEDVRRRLCEQPPGEGASNPDRHYLADHLQGALPAISLVSQSGLITAFANDVAADMIFAQQVYGYGREGDALLGISTSGNSRNVLNALRVARAQGLSTVGLTGRDGGSMKALCDVTMIVPKKETSEIQERHLPIYHALCIMLEHAFFPD